MSTEHSKDGKNPARSIDGLLGGLSGLIDSLASLAEKGESLRRETEHRTPDGRDVRVSYGLNVRTAGGPAAPTPRPVSRPAPRTDDAREPAAELFEEPGAVLVVAEMPGVEAADIRVEVAGDRLDLTAARASRKYKKTMRLPAPVDPDAAQITVTNGIAEIRLPRLIAGGSAQEDAA